MISRAQFYPPFPGMWSGAFGSTSGSGSKHSSYSAASGNGASFGYPPTPPKDGTPDQVATLRVLIAFLLKVDY